jgi:hypothetical protein
MGSGSTLFQSIGEPAQPEAMSTRAQMELSGTRSVPTVVAGVVAVGSGGEGAEGAS